jgi:hypothetical protein
MTNTQERDDLIRQYAEQGFGTKRIAQLIGAKTKTVRKRKIALGIPIQEQVPSWSAAEDDALVSMWNAGETATAIALSLRRGMYGTRARINALQAQGLIETRKTHAKPPSVLRPARTNRLVDAAKESGLPYELILKLERLRSSRGSGWNKTVKHARLFPLSFMIDLWKEQGGLCQYTGAGMAVDNSGASASVDRVDPTKGYEEGNVVLCCKAINLMKGNFSVTTFVELCRAVVECVDDPDCRAR